MIYWLSTLAPGEVGYYVADWTDEMAALSDTITGTPTFKWIDSDGAEQTTLNGLRFQNVAIGSAAKKVEVYIDNSDWSGNETAALAGSPYTIKHTISTTNGATLIRMLGLIVTEEGDDLVTTVGGATSDSYGTLAEADLYHVNRGNTDWSGTDSERARKLRRGAAALDARYRHLWKGYKASSGQALAWPRDAMTDDDGNLLSASSIPSAVKHAQFEMARAVASDMTVDAPNSIERVKAGSVEVEFAGGPRQRTILSFVDELMRPYIVAGGRRLVRAG